MHNYPVLVEHCDGDVYRARFCFDSCDLAHGVDSCCVDFGAPFDKLAERLTAYGFLDVVESVREWRESVLTN